MLTFLIFAAEHPNTGCFPRVAHRRTGTARHSRDQCSQQYWWAKPVLLVRRRQCCATARTGSVFFKIPRNPTMVGGGVSFRDAAAVSGARSWRRAWSITRVQISDTISSYLRLQVLAPVVVEVLPLLRIIFKNNYGF